jgi:hypothetical protein
MGRTECDIRNRYNRVIRADVPIWPDLPEEEDEKEEEIDDWMFY